MKLVTDSGLVFARELRPLLREPFYIVFGLIQPLVFLGLYGPLLGGMPNPFGGNPLQWFVPGVLVMLALFGTSTTGANLQAEIQSGSHERMLVTPLSRSALLIGRAFKEIAPTLAQAALIILVTLPFGFELHAETALTGLVILAVFSVGLGALSYSLALAVREMGFWVVQQTLLFPMLILSGMLLPLELGPAWLQAASRLNPLTYIVEAERALFAGDATSGAALAGAIVAIGTCIVGLSIGTWSMRRAGR